MKKFIRNEDGATAIEYGLICALIVIACIAAMTQLGIGSNSLWTKVSNNVEPNL